MEELVRGECVRFDKDGNLILTKRQHFILGQIAANQGADFSKAEIAEKAKVSVKTVDRALRLLREEGFIRAEPRFRESGAQAGNAYYIIPKDGCK